MVSISRQQAKPISRIICGHNHPHLAHFSGKTLKETPKTTPVTKSHLLLRKIKPTCSCSERQSQLIYNRAVVERYVGKRRESGSLLYIQEPEVKLITTYTPHSYIMSPSMHFISLTHHWHTFITVKWLSFKSATIILLSL